MWWENIKKDNEKRNEGANNMNTKNAENLVAVYIYIYIYIYKTSELEDRLEREP